MSREFTIIFDQKFNGERVIRWGITLIVNESRKMDQQAYQVVLREATQDAVNEWLKTDTIYQYKSKESLENKTTALFAFLSTKKKLGQQDYVVKTVFSCPHHELNGFKTSVNDKTQRIQTVALTLNSKPVNRKQRALISIATSRTSSDLLTQFKENYSKDYSHANRLFKKAGLVKDINNITLNNWGVILLHAIDRDSRWSTRLFSKGGRSRTSRVLIDLGLVKFENGCMIAITKDSPREFAQAAFDCSTHAQLSR